jgi:hypothetical protein
MIIRPVAGRKLTLIAVATVALAIAASATAHADDGPFRSPSGNISCVVGNGGAACDVSDHTYQLPPGPPCSQHSAWGGRFSLQQGQAAEMECHNDTLRVPGARTLDYGQTISAGTITCESQPSGMKCTDSSTGHYFRVSRDSYNLG